MGKPKPTLADHIADPDLHLSKDLVKSNLFMGIRQYEVFVLDDEAAIDAILLSTDMPRVISQLIDAADPPFDKTFIEMSSNAVMATRRRLQMAVGTSEEEARERFPSRPPECRMGVLVTRRDNIIEVQCIEHGQDGDYPKVFEWPVYYEISLDDFRFERAAEGVNADGRGVRYSRRGRLKAKEQEGRLWGFGPDVPGLVSQLGKRCRLGIVRSHFSLMTDKGAEYVNAVTTELSGFTRMALGCLALLNTKLASLEKVEPKARHMKANRKGTKKLLDYSIVTMKVPGRVKDREKYVRRQVQEEAARKRYHQVRGHYRHMKTKPSTPGWKEVQVNGETLWRKHIPPHHRGDIQLGMVERDHTIVKG